MGMFDSVKVVKNNVGIPEGEYQTKALDCRLAEYLIDENGKLSVVYPGVDGYPDTCADDAKYGCLCIRNLDLYTDTPTGWVEFEVNISDNQVSMVNATESEDETESD